MSCNADCAEVTRAEASQRRFYVLWDVSPARLSASPGSLMQDTASHCDAKLYVFGVVYSQILSRCFNLLVFLFMCRTILAAAIACLV